MAQLDEYGYPVNQVYTGFWIDWSRGLVSGSTLTIATEFSGSLTAFLAIFISASGSALWRIMSYALHQIRATPDCQDGLHHQHQVILRNTSSPNLAAWQFMKVAWTWRKIYSKSLLRSGILFALAVISPIFFIAASVFSPKLIRISGNERLLKFKAGHKCGRSIADDQRQDYLDATYLRADTYVKNCYRKTAEVPQNSLCTFFPARQIGILDSLPSNNVSCPFKPELCSSGNETVNSIQMDSGQIDSHKDLGINAPIDARIIYRRLTTCSPLPTPGYLFKIPHENYTAERLYYGAVQHDIGENNTETNYTCELGKVGLNAVEGDLSDDEGVGYNLQVLTYFSRSLRNLWKPIPALQQPDADISLFILSSRSIRNIHPITDPFFGARTEHFATLNRNFFTADSNLTALACIDQHQFCNPINQVCTPPTASNMSENELSRLDFSARQRAVADRLAFPVATCSIGSSFLSVGSLALKATESLLGLWQLSPDIHWNIEVERWFYTGLAELQHQVMDWTLETVLGVENATIDPNNPFSSETNWTGRYNESLDDNASDKSPQMDQWQQSMCSSQKIRSSNATTSFSVLGISIILSVGSSLIATSLLLEPILSYVRKKNNINDHKRLQWVLDENLRLRQLAYEQDYQRTWEGRASANPEKGDVFGIPARVDENHPRLRKGYGETPDPEVDETEMELLVVQKRGRDDDEEIGGEIDEELGDLGGKCNYGHGDFQDESKLGSRDGLKNNHVD